jgi:hypothetical protein
MLAYAMRAAATIAVHFTALGGARTGAVAYRRRQR